jgi:hypothetical protein
MKRELTTRYAFLALFGALTVNRDMCLGGGNPVPREPEKQDSGSTDGGRDASLRGSPRAPRYGLPGSFQRDVRKVEKA